MKRRKKTCQEFLCVSQEEERNALTLSYDDGVEQDRRLMQIMDAHGLKGTFNLNSRRICGRWNRIS